MSPSSSNNDTAGSAKKERKAKITPLPLSQMIPMTIVIMNESICGTMLMPFVGPYVAFLKGIPVNEAGYYSGILIGMFMLGQVVSAKTWGRISDKYGRRFPIISGLFTSGVMMLGFGLSTNVWMCAVFRFFQGLFNGNVLVAKTMMADITDRTNQAGGFSFMSLCAAFGFLIGPTLGGLLYDPAHSSGMAWAHFDPKGFLHSHPAFLTSLVVFMYTNIGMVVCTFLVKESNPHAQPLPGFVRLIYPCMWYKSEPFVLPPIQYEDDEEEEEGEEISENSTARSSGESGGGGSAAVKAAVRGSREYMENSSQDARELQADGREQTADGRPFPREVVLTPSDTTGGSPTFSPVSKGTVEAHHLAEVEEMMTMPVTRHTAGSGGRGHYDKRSFTSPVQRLEEDDDDVCVGETVVLVEINKTGVDGKGESASGLSTHRGRNGESDDGDRDGGADEAEEDSEVVTKFGYREAFARPSTRFMLSQYMVLSATDMVARDCFPLWAVSTVSVGGLGLTSSQVGYILLANSAPCLAANVLFRIVERYFDDKMGLFRVGVAGAGAVVMLLPFNSRLPHASLWMYVFVFLCTGGRQVFASWCYSLNTMLTARAAPPGHVGSIMGINQSCGSLVRGIMPFLAAPIYAWSISEKHIFPFNHALVFFVSSLLFFFCWWRSYGLRTDRVGHVLLVQ